MSEKAVMLFDGDCGFCRRWIEKWKAKTGDKVAYHPYQKVIHEYPQIREEDCQKAVHLVVADGTVYSGAHAVLKALSLAGHYRLVLWSYEHIAPVRWVLEGGYHFVARSRSWLSRWI